MTTPAGPIHACLRAARNRLLVQRLFDGLSIGFLMAAGLVATMAAARFIQGAASLFTVSATLGLAVAAILIAVLAACARRPSLARTANLLDHRANTHDRFHTALEFAARSGRTHFEDLTLAECARFATNFSVRRWTPWHLPRTLPYLAIPLLLGAGLFAYARFHPYQAPRPTALDGAIARQADDLKTFADQVRQKSPDANTPELDRLAEEMKNSARRLRENKARPDAEKLKTALRELSSLEAMLRDMKDAARQQRSSPEEMAALTAALAASGQTRAAADALEAGDPAGAGAQLAKLLAQLKQQGDAAQTLQQLAQSMQEQAAKLTEGQKNEVAEQMRQAAQAAQSGQPQLSQQSLERLAQVLKRLGGNKPGNGQNQRRQASAGQRGAAGPPMTEQQLQQLIESLENMKEGLLQPGGDGPGKPGDPSQGRGSLASVESFAKPGGSEPGFNPSGVPGGEKDAGHDGKIFDDKPVANEPSAGVAKRMTGLPGEGESQQELVNAAGDSSKAGRAYRQLYEAAAPAAQDAVEQENIPLGSRRFVRRYFENIRPPN